ncbi:class I SAM-dependent methyltransferase [Bradyrhizobium sp. BR 1432]|uniref:class I SAM-dependent methyltransferase n=1 Tax=Bradyrhizobium sp. BR 1432 TaxID=3447966 RepID=UPI003EE733CA
MLEKLHPDVASFVLSAFGHRDGSAMSELSWSPKALTLFQDLMESGPPAAFKESATRAVWGAAMNAARRRGGKTVEEADVASGCLRVAPPAFRPNVVANLERRGVLAEQVPLFTCDSATNLPGSGARAAAQANSPPDPGASAWERIHERIIPYRDETERIIGKQAQKGSCRILDLACGTGRHLIEAARLGHRCTGIDQQAWKIERAQAHSAQLGLDAEFLCGDLRTLTVPAIYDIVVCLYAMSTMKTDADIAAVFATVDQALLPTGRFVFNVLNRDAISGANPLSSDGHLRTFAKDEILGHARKAGFELLDITLFDVADTKDLDIFLSMRRMTTDGG